MRTPSLVTARADLTRRLEQWLELPLTILAVVWLLQAVVEFLRGENRALSAAITIGIAAGGGRIPEGG